MLKLHRELSKQFIYQQTNTFVHHSPILKLYIPNLVLCKFSFVIVSVSIFKCTDYYHQRRYYVNSSWSLFLHIIIIGYSNKYDPQTLLLLIEYNMEAFSQRKLIYIKNKYSHMNCFFIYILPSLSTDRIKQHLYQYF